MKLLLGQAMDAIPPSPEQWGWTNPDNYGQLYWKPAVHPGSY